jgi:hypothetical protein
MNKLMLDAALATKLQDLNEAVDLCDPSGCVLGRFLPVTNMADWEPVSPDVSEEELDRREQSKDWFTTEEVLARLKSLEQS